MGVFLSVILFLLITRAILMAQTAHFQALLERLPREVLLLSVQCQMSPCGILKPIRDGVEKYFLFLYSNAWSTDSIKKKSHCWRNVNAKAAKWERFSIVHY